MELPPFTCLSLMAHRPKQLLGDVSSCGDHPADPKKEDLPHPANRLKVKTDPVNNGL